jgi:hypothetical protein
VAQFEGLADLFGDLLLDLLHFLLRIHEAFGDWIGEEDVALPVEGGDFGAGQGVALVLFVVKLLAGFAQQLVLALGVGIGHEGFHPLADALELGLLDDGFAKFTGLAQNSVFGLNDCLHNFYGLMAPVGRPHNLPALGKTRQ